jgi:hypothetical protein
VLVRSAAPAAAPGGPPFISGCGSRDLSWGTLLIDRSKLFCLGGLCARGCKAPGIASLLPDETADTAGLSDRR